MLERIYRGDIYYADLTPVIGSEQGGIRPVLIIQNNIGNYYSPTVIVAAVSARTARKPRIPTHVCVGQYTGLKEESLILLEQIRTIDKARLQSFVGKVDEKDMEHVNRCFRISLELKDK